MDFGDFEKQGASMLNILRDMEQGLTRNMQEVSKMEGAGPIADKMKDLQVLIKSGNMAGILKMQEEIIKMQQQENGGTSNGN